MKIGIYIESSRSGLGGAEYTAAVLAESLRKDHAVEIVNHRSSGTIADFENAFRVDLGGVRLRLVPAEPPLEPSTANPWRRHREERQWRADLSSPYDVFCAFVHGLPPFCHAQHGLLTVLFPRFDRFRRWGRGGRIPTRGGLRAMIRSGFYEWNWRRRMATYDARLAISEFTRDWVRRFWGVDCRVVYPPVDTDVVPNAGEKAILSVGRFTRTGHAKRQLDMMSAFADLESAHARGWSYRTVGTVGNDSENEEYFDLVRRAASGLPAEVVRDVDHTRLSEWYRQSAIFWHAAGYEVDEDLDPGRTEHFGIVTLEAMAAGCVPVVVGKGGQKEIVEHGVSGFLWQTIEELKEYTMLLVDNESLRVRMSRAARIRAQRFGKRQFIETMRALMAPYLEGDGATHDAKRAHGG